MPTIRKSVYIGLGGTGIKAIANAKRMYEEIFGKGNIPPYIKFVAIDFDKAIAKDPQLPTTIKEDFIELPQSANPHQTYVHMSSRGLYKWLFPKNANYLPNSIQNGASQVRTTGRLLTELIMPHIQQKIDNALQLVMNIDNTPDGYDVAPDSRVDVHIAMSLAGGTGCGSFINVAQYIKEKHGAHVVLFGYGVLYSVFRTMDPSGLATPRVRLNSYSAIQDLDYLQSASITNPVSFMVGNAVKTITSPLYDYFYVVDNKNANEDVVPHVNVLCQALGTCMYLAGGELGAAVRSMFSNAEWTLGNYNWDNKLGWAHRVGVCQVVYDGNKLAQMYALKANIELIRQFLTPGTDIEQMATNWTEVARVREDGDDYNMLIDSIYSPDSIGKVREPALSIDDAYEVTKSEVNKYVDNLQTFPDKAEILKIRDRILKDLGAKVAEIVSNDCGVANGRTFLETLATICAGYKNEMETERKEKLTSVESKLSAIESSLKDYQEYLKKLFSTKSGKSERLGDIARQAKVILKEKLEARRRKEAADIFADLINEINAALTNVKELEAALGALKTGYSEELAKKQNAAGASSLMFEYDLSVKERLNMTLKPGEVLLSDFVNYLKAPLAGMKKDEFAAALEAYTATLPRCAEYKEQLIETVINGLDDAEYRKLKYEVEKKSTPLLSLNDRGLLDPLTTMNPIQKMNQQYLVSIYKADKDVKSRMETDPGFSGGGSAAEFIPSTTPTMKQRVIFYRADAAIIPYCIAALDDAAVYEYETILSQVSAGNAMFHPHFDLQIFEEMRKRDFKLKPEMTDEAMFYWVAGQIFGWTEVVEKARIMEKGPNGETLKEISKEEVKHPKYIRFDKSKYSYWDEKSPGRGQSGKWADSPTSDRKRAFEFFKSDVLTKLHDDFKELIIRERNSRGSGYYDTLVEELKTAGKQDYIDKLMCSNKSSVTYYGTNGNTLESEFVDQEWAYLDEKFQNALKLLK